MESAPHKLIASGTSLVASCDYLQRDRGNVKHDRILKHAAKARRVGRKATYIVKRAGSLLGIDTATLKGVVEADGSLGSHLQQNWVLLPFRRGASTQSEMI